MLGGEMFEKSTEDHTVTIYKNAERNFKVGDTFTFPIGDGETVKGKNSFPTADFLTTAIADGKKFVVKWVDMTHGKRGICEVTAVDAGTKEVTLKIDNDGYSAPFSEAATELTKVRFFWEEEIVEEGKASEIVISPDTYPGTYRVVGDALIRSEATGKDEAFQFIIEKAKMLSEVTLTMQAEGDPSAFSMTLNVLRDNNGEMMRLVKY